MWSYLCCHKDNTFLKFIHSLAQRRVFLTIDKIYGLTC